MNTQHQVKTLLGLPTLSRGALLEKARELSAPILISGNCLSKWKEVDGGRHWTGFNTRALKNADGLELHLDSAGFVAMHRYGGFPWSVEDYIDLAASYPFKRFSSMDLCVEAGSVAKNDREAYDRIAKTVQLNNQCERLARERNISHSFMPVIQGNYVDQYAWCVEQMACMLEDYPVIGVGSMCRRNLHGPDGILSVVSALGKILPQGVQLHPFGLKSAGAEAIRPHPRIHSIDSQSYGVVARQKALKEGISKSNQLVSEVMEDWFRTQQSRLGKGSFAFQESFILDLPPSPQNIFKQKLSEASETLRDLIMDNEIDATQILDHYLLSCVTMEMGD